MPKTRLPGSGRAASWAPGTGRNKNCSSLYELQLRFNACDGAAFYLRHCHIRTDKLTVRLFLRARPRHFSCYVTTSYSLPHHHLPQRGMQSDNGIVRPAPVSAPAVNDAAQKADLIRQFARPADASDGGLIAQLTGNPFFTAVSIVGVEIEDRIMLTTPQGLWTRRTHCDRRLWSTRHPPWSLPSAPPSSRRRRNQCPR